MDQQQIDELLGQLSSADQDASRVGALATRRVDNKVLLCDRVKIEARIKDEPEGSLNLRALNGLGQPKAFSLASRSMLGMLESLEQEQPNFEKVIRRIRLSLHVRILRNRPAQFRPILLYGPPGIGKSRFVGRLSKILQLPVNNISLSGTNDFLLVTGSSRAWKQACPGMVARGFADSDVANPVFIFDEVDKVGKSDQGNSLDRLLLLLESETAMEFMDDFVETPIDASHCSVIAMANSIDNLPAPFLSRFECIPIEPLDIEGRRIMIRTVYQELIGEHELHGVINPSIGNDVVEQLLESELNGRELKRALCDAIEQVCLSIPLSGMTKVPLPSLDSSHIRLERPKQAGRIGFVRAR